MADTIEKKLAIVEIFHSIQGEGSLIGTPMVFVRLWGCDMQCSWCDTRYSWAPEFSEKTPRTYFTPTELAEHLLKKYPITQWINFTGGEPALWWPRLLQAIQIIKNKEQKNTQLLPHKKFCIQTNGKHFPESFTILDKICMDIKCPSSGEKSNISFLEKLRTNDDVKFVIANHTDLNYAISTLKKVQTKANIIFQPVLLPSDSLETYFERIRWIISESLSLPWNIRILPQYHQLLWRNQKGK